MPDRNRGGSENFDSSGWPAISYEHFEWNSIGRPPRADRLIRSYAAAVPPFIAGASVRPGAAAAAALDAATTEIVRLDTEVGTDLLNVAGALLRSESVASSKIEQLNATSQELGIAALRSGNKRQEATLVLRNVEAMQHALDIAAHGESFRVGDILGVHHVLMRDDPHEAKNAGSIRTEQNWIGGSDFSPRNALFVPPHHERVPTLLDDLIKFMNRTDTAGLPQAFIAHAQFETIHPFVDGNGRTGRALIHSVLRRRGIARVVAVPTSAGLLANVEEYFAALTFYRAGDVDGYLVHVATAAQRVAHEANSLTSELRKIRDRWTETVRPRRGSVLLAIIDLLGRQPVVDLEALRTATFVNKSNLYRAIEELTLAGALTEVTGDRRNQIWAATELNEVVDAFLRRLGPRQAPRST